MNEIEDLLSELRIYLLCGPASEEFIVELITNAAKGLRKAYNLLKNLEWKFGEEKNCCGLCKESIVDGHANDCHFTQ